MQISERMTPNPTTVAPGDSLAAAKALMEAEGFHHLPVVEKGALVGIVSEREVRAHAGFLEATKVNAAMIARVVTVPPTASLEEATRSMLDHKVRALPVVDRGTLVGIVTTTDILKAYLDLSRKSGLGTSGR
jgi:acetoin utilization protein AcuB